VLAPFSERPRRAGRFPVRSRTRRFHLCTDGTVLAHAHPLRCRAGSKSPSVMRNGLSVRALWRGSDRSRPILLFFVILDVRSTAGTQGIVERIVCPWVPVTLRVPRMTRPTCIPLAHGRGAEIAAFVAGFHDLLCLTLPDPPPSFRARW